MMKTKDYISPESEFRVLDGGKIICSSVTTFEAVQNEPVQNEGIGNYYYEW